MNKRYSEYCKDCDWKVECKNGCISCPKALYGNKTGKMPEEQTNVDLICSTIAKEYTEQIILAAKEEENNFIFRTIKPFLNEAIDFKINKRVLIRALYYFKTEHKEEFEMLMKEGEE